MISFNFDRNNLADGGAGNISIEDEDEDKEIECSFFSVESIHRCSNSERIDTARRGVLNIRFANLLCLSLLEPKCSLTSFSRVFEDFAKRIGVCLSDLPENEEIEDDETDDEIGGWTLLTF